MDARRLAEMEEQWDTVPAAQHVAESKLRAALTQVQFERNRLENDLAAARAEVAQLRAQLRFYEALGRAHANGE